MADYKDAPPPLEVGDVVVSKFGNLWKCEAVDGSLYVLRNRPQETPEATGTVRAGPFPAWGNRIQRDGLWLWERPTPRCKCEKYAKAKGPYPSGFCPDCRQWFPGVGPEEASR